MDESDDRIAAIEARLDTLHRESEERRSELRAIAAELPAATSRRQMLATMAGGIVHAPDKPLVAKRVVLKLLRTPSDLARRARAR